MAQVFPEVWTLTRDCAGRKCGCRPCVCRYGHLVRDNSPAGLTVGQIEDAKLKAELDAWASRFNF